MADFQFNNECLIAHNSLRKAHNTESLTYDESLAEASQEYAELLARNESLEHSKSAERINIGENLAYSCKSYANYKFSGRGASIVWYSEIKDYNFSNEKQKEGNPPTGHFTQVIWKNSKKAGFGRAQSANKGWYIVGRYSPAGNVLEHYRENVLPSRYSKWEDVPMVLEYLEELRSMEFTTARKHILDKCTHKMQIKNIDGKKTYNITETFDSIIYGNYSATEDFLENPVNLPRPYFDDFKDNENSIYSAYEDNSDYQLSFDEDSHDDSLSKDQESFQDIILNRHNFYRKKHNVENLQIDHKLSELAQNWAETLAEQNSLGFCGYRFENSELGENISSIMKPFTPLSAEGIIDRWYDEHKFYTFKEEPELFSKVGHFTQLIWRRSKKIGIGLAENSYGQNYFVCLYYPPGNVHETFVTNVLKFKE